MFDVALIGAGVLGGALAAEAKRLGLSTVVIGTRGISPSFVAGAAFRLNTWTRHGQHPSLEAAITALDGSRFPVASTLPRAAARALSASKVARVPALATRLTTTTRRVRVWSGNSAIDARAAVLALGWGPAKQLPSGAREFSDALLCLSRGALEGRVLGVVGGGPGALSFLEACVGLSPAPGLGLHSRQRVVWLSGPPGPERPPAIEAMFRARYTPLLQRVARRPAVVTRLERKVVRVVRQRARFTLEDDRHERHEVDELIWCTGYEAPLELIRRGATRLRPFRRGGVRLALQRVGARGPEPIFQLGPALDQLGYASWDLGPFAEWFEKGRRLLAELAGD
jgi:thioredoxin reductase